MHDTNAFYDCNDTSQVEYQSVFIPPKHLLLSRDREKREHAKEKEGRDSTRDRKREEDNVNTAVTKQMKCKL
jgi:hypothetical protein